MVGALSFTLTRYLPDARTFDLMTSLLRSESKRIRLYAVLAAGAAGFEQWAALVPMLADPDKTVRQSACLEFKKARIYGQLRKSDLQAIGAIAGVIRLLDDRTPHVRYQAAHTLLRIDPRGSRPLVEAACKRERVRWCKKSMIEHLA